MERIFLAVDRAKRVEHTLTRTARLLEQARQLGADTRRILHDARNSRHHAALLRTISKALRRARLEQAT